MFIHILLVIFVILMGDVSYVFSQKLNSWKKNPSVDAIAPGMSARRISSISNHIELDIKFDFNSFVIKPESYEYLNGIAKAIMTPEFRNQKYVIEGHTDSRGSNIYNKELSINRAKAVKKYITNTHGINPNAFLVLGFGETELLDKSNTENAHDRNRRVIIRPVRSHNYHNQISKDENKFISILLFANYPKKDNNVYSDLMNIIAKYTIKRIGKIHDKTDRQNKRHFV